MTGLHHQMVIGIMADSHGQPATIAAAVRYLKEIGCTALIHLGDICDSQRPETAWACIDLIQRHGITALKGNNDHSLAGNLAGRQDRDELQAAADYIRSLPLVYHHAGATFTHSRPFVEELGPAALIGSMDKSDVRRFFAAAPGSILFRGHAHDPGIILLETGHIISRSLAPRDALDLSEKMPCVVTCGALTRGFCMLWRPGDAQLICHRLPDFDPNPSMHA